MQRKNWIRNSVYSVPTHHWLSHLDVQYKSKSQHIVKMLRSFIANGFNGNTEMHSIDCGTHMQHPTRMSLRMQQQMQQPAGQSLSLAEMQPIKILPFDPINCRILSEHLKQFTTDFFQVKFDTYTSHKHKINRKLLVSSFLSDIKSIRMNFICILIANELFCLV